MEDRRWRKVMALAMATVVILGVSVQNAYAAPDKSAEKILSRVLDLKTTFVGQIASDVREIVEESQLIRLFIDKLSSSADSEPAKEDSITVLVEQVSLEEVLRNYTRHEHEIIIGNEREAGNSPVPYSRGGTILQEDLELLARIIHAEARGESLEGQVAVGAVVLNRVKDPNFPMTIREVIYQPGQFTAVADGQIKLAPNKTAFLAARLALEGQDPSKGAIFYYNPKLATDKWIKTRNVIKTIGNHKFCV